MFGFYRVGHAANNHLSAVVHGGIKMRVFGGLLWLIALLCFMGAFGMDTSVSTGAGGRVHNIGLMRTQENAILLV